MIPEHETDGGTGFAVRVVVRQIVVGAEAFVVFPRADAAGEVEMPGDEMIPEPVARVTEIGQCAVEIHRADGVASDFGLSADRLMCLIVAVVLAIPILGTFTAGTGFLIEVVRLPAAFVDEVAGEIEVATFAGSAMEFDQSEFDFFVAAVAAFLAGTASEYFRDVISVPAKSLEEFALAGRFVMRDGGCPAQ